VWLFGSTSEFDNASGFDHGAASSFLDNIAGFKFQNLILASDPTIDTTSGVTNLALVGVNGITTGDFPSTFTFAGIDTLLLATQSGSIDLMSDYTFDGPSRIFIYARGTGSHLTIGSTISADIDLHLFSEGTLTISGALTTTHFSSFSNGDFRNTIGSVTANDFSVTSQAGNINITSDSFRPASSHISLSLVAGGAIAIRMGSDLSLFASADSIFLSGSGITLRTKVGVLTLNLNVLSPAVFTAGTGGILAPSISFMTTGGLELHSDGDIRIHGADIPLVNGHRTLSGVIETGGNFHAVSNVTTGTMTVNGNLAIDDGDLSVINLSAGSTVDDTVDVAGNISASQAVTAAGNINTNNLTAGTTINVGGAVSAGDVTAGGNIAVGSDLIATRVTSGGNVNAYGVAVPTVSVHGALTVGDDGIFPYVDPNVGADLQHTITADTVTASGGIFFISALYGGINGLSHGGLLTINAHSILFDDGSQGIGFTDLDGADVGDFGGAVSEAGDGGTLIVRTSGNITATSDTIIIARTGLTPPDLPFGGAGGHVTLDSSAGLVSFDGLVRVSAYAPFESHGDPQRRSTSGGFITLHSGLTSGMAINVGDNALLQALLGDDAPGPGGLIQLVSEGGDIVVKGQLEADHGNILITNLGFPAAPHGNTSMGDITLNGSGFTASTFEIDSGRNLNIGLNTSVDFNANSALTLSAANALRFGDFVSTSFVTDVIGNVMISAGSISANSILIDRISGGPSQGINISMEADNNISVTNTFQIVADDSFSTIGDGVNISIDAGSLAAQSLNLTVANNSGFLSGTGGNLDVLVGGNLSANTINALVNNSVGGFIGSGGNMSFNIGGTLSTTHAASFLIDNHQNSTLGGDVLLGLSAAGISVADSLTARIDNSGGSSIGGEAKIDLHAGEATVGTDATIEIIGSDGANSATINIGPGTYSAGGTFRTYIDGNGTIGLNNASIHGDVLKVGALGANGALNIGGGTLSADTTLKLYASGSNGQLNFISDVTLGGNSEKILAANSVTIFDGVTVTIGGPNAANVFTNNANYTGFGGNESTTGTFSGAGANDPVALDQAPPFDDSARPATTGTQQPKPATSSPHVPKKGRTTIMVVDSGQLNSLLDRPDSGASSPPEKPVTDRTAGGKHSGRKSGAARPNSVRSPETNPRISAIPARNL
jgi:hypothetical protein